MSETTQSESETVERDDRPAFVRDVVSGRLSGTVVNPENGEHLDAVFKDPTDAELEALEALEQQAMDGEVDADRSFGNKIVDDFLLAIEDDGTTYEGADLPAASDLGMAWKQSVTVGFLKILGADNAALRDAEEFFEERLGGNE